MPRPPPEATDPVWANTKKNIPKQNEAFAATSAAKLHNTEQRVALPPRRLRRDAVAERNELLVEARTIHCWLITNFSYLVIHT